MPACLAALLVLGPGSIATAQGAQATRPAADPAPGAIDLSPLSTRDAALYRKVFALQDAAQGAADWAAADALIDRLEDPLLLGHLLLQRYMHPSAWRAQYDELAAWLERYGDHPGAWRAYRLSLRRRPADAPAPSKPVRGYLGGAGQERNVITRVSYRTSRARTPAEDEAVRAWRERIERLSADHQPLAAAEALTDLPPLVDRVEIDLARWAIARAQFAVGDDLAAFKLARRAAGRTGRIVPEIHWIAGISAWRLGRIEVAARHFAALANAEGAHQGERARAAFWAARAYVIEQKPQLVGDFLAIAATDAYGFYGVLARAVLGEEAGYDWAHPDPQDSGLQAVLRFAGARRALALAQVGRADLAEREIRKLAARISPELMVGLITLAGTLDLPAAQMRLAQSLRDRKDQYHDGALYPLPSWVPAAGFTVDRALVFAVMRAESAFDPAAESPVGARGLMQVMPATAKEIAARSELELQSHDDMFEPATAIMFGQAYLSEILRWPAIGDNLMFVAAAYNAGPGRVRQWQRSLALDHDPLLFLESIPVLETRIYVKQVLTNLWTYRDRLGQASPSLEALAMNTWPSYHTLDAKQTLHAWN